MKYLFLSLALLGLMIPLACNYVTPTSNNNSGFNNGRGSTPTATATNLNGWTSTPTATLQPTPAFVGIVSTGISAPNGIAYASPYIYVAEGLDASVSQVQVLNASNNTVNWTWPGSGTNLFQSPNGVAVNSGGTTVYVLDVNPSSDHGTVYALAPAATPTPITSWASYNGTTLYYPGGLAVGANGNVYVADTGNYQLEVFGPTGNTIASWLGNGSMAPSAVALDTSSNIYVADGQNNELWVLTLSGSTFTVSKSWALPDNPSADNQYVAYYGLAIDNSGNVFVADYFNSHVEVYSTSGSLIGLFDGNQTGATPLVGPDGLLIYNNNIYVTDYDNNPPNPTSSTGMIEIFGPDTY